MSDLQERLAALLDVTEAVGAYCLERFGRLQSVSIEEKAPADYVSRVDREAEMLGRDLLARSRPAEAVVGEEFGGEAGADHWLIDPVDGTANFLSGLPLWAVSIAYVRDGIPVLGAIGLPALSSIMYGGAGLGVTATGMLQRNAGQRALAFGIGRNGIWPAADRTALEHALEAEGYHIVSLGSCAASMAFAAAGRLAGYVERGLQAWDCAAGVALCREAGLETATSPFAGDDRLSVEVSRSPVTGTDRGRRRAIG